FVSVRLENLFFSFKGLSLRFNNNRKDMSITFESRYAIGPNESKSLDTTGLRENFLIEKLFFEDQVHFVYTHYDRYMAGGAFPVSKKVKLETIEPLLKEPYFLSRREVGIINVGGNGKVAVDGETFEVNNKEDLYIGKGSKEVYYSSNDTSNSAKFYLNSTPAHHTYPTKRVTREDANKIELGSMETANHRVINQMLLHTVIQTCQLQMGMTELKPGSVWNTMPSHTHDRRMEV